GVNMSNGGNLWVTDTDVRQCNNGVDVSGLANMVVQNSRFSECQNGVFLKSVSGTVTGLVSNCTATLCATGFLAKTTGSGNADLTLTDSRAFDNVVGISVQAGSTGSATIRIANCVVTQNTLGLQGFQDGSGPARVIGTNPGTNLIAGNTNGNATGNVPIS